MFSVSYLLLWFGLLFFGLVALGYWLCVGVCGLFRCWGCELLFVVVCVVVACCLLR